MSRALQKAIKKIENGTATNEDIQIVIDALRSNEKGFDLAQLGKFNINIKEGREIQIGDRNTFILDEESFQVIAEALNKKANKTEPGDVPQSILLLSSDPKSPQSSRQRDEAKEIRKALKRSKYSALFNLQDRSDIDPETISQELSEIQPRFVHISGMDNGIEKLVLETSYTGPSTEKESEAKAVAQLFKLHADNVKCIFLNSCHSEKQSDLLAKHIDFVILIPRSLRENLATKFSTDFYYHIAIQKSIVRSFEMSLDILVRLNESFRDNKKGRPVLLQKSLIKLEEELEACENEIRKCPKKAELWKKKASILVDLGRVEEASNSYEQASLLEPKDHKIRSKQGDDLDKFGKHKEAITAYDKGIEIEEDDYKLWWSRARSLVSLDQYQEALESYEIASLLEPPDDDEYIIAREYGEVLTELKRYSESIKAYNKSLSIEPKYRASSYQKKIAYKKRYQGQI